MRYALRTFLVGLMVFALTFNPAVACHSCHGWGGQHSYYPAYYGCGGCGGCDVVVYDECGDCGGCGSCGGCDLCGDVVVEERASEPKHEPTPEVRADVRPELPVTPEQPAIVERPVEAAPLVPPQTPPAEDLFNGTEATTTPPAETPTTEPVLPAETPAEPADDLFSPPTETPAESTPAETAPAADPAETPATEPADDLFGGAEGAESAPAESETMPADTEAAPAETPAAAPAEGEAPAEEESDDIFGASRDVLRQAGGLASNEMRPWVDNTGRFSVNARLVRFLDGHVRLLKENGRTTTVPLDRLSASDLRFVNRQASAQRATTIQTAQATSAMPGLAN